MSITDSQKTDFLWKKVIFGNTNTVGAGVTGAKQGFEETIGSPILVSKDSILADDIPVPAPNATGPVVQYYPPTSGGAIQMTMDPTAPANRAWLATSTFGLPGTRLTGWVPPSSDPGYLVEIYRNDPTVPGNRLNQSTTGQEWVFDYTAGVLNFVNTIPSGITTLWLVGHRYIGRTGFDGITSLNIRDAEVIYTGSTLTAADESYELPNFFNNDPILGSIVVEINGGRINQNMWSISDRNLTINLVNLPYDLESGDTISATYAWSTN